MKTIMLISGTALLFFAGSQVCGCGSCTANAQTTTTEIVKSEPKTVTLKVTGMTCAGCANHISASLDKLDGVLEQEVKFPGDIAIVKYDPDKTSEKDIIAAIGKTGKYKAEITTEGGSEKGTLEKKSCAPGCKKSCCSKKGGGC